MKIILVFCNLVLSGILFGQEVSPKFSEITIDSTLDDDFFHLQNMTQSFSGGTTIVTNHDTGKSDTFYTPTIERDIIENCRIDELGRHHLGFDNCIAYFQKDTLVIQFQNNNANTQESAYWDKMILHIIKNRFYAEYVWTSKSYDRLSLQGQLLKLKKLPARRGEHLMGRLSIQFENNDPRVKDKSVHFNGPFNVSVD
ncbi:MAG TPA: hypothetical protein VKR53_16315 [Puia sp.]|nr:hypothetical protein [Puia sp.]